MTRKQKGILLIIWPPILFFVVLTTFAIASFVISSLLAGQVEGGSAGLAQASASLTIMKIIRVVLGFGGILSVLGGPISVIFGIYLLVKSDQPAVPGATPQPPQPKI